MLQFSLLSLQFCSSALTDLPLCQVSPYSPPPLMFATARTPPRCRTKISLDTLKKQTDRRLLLFSNFYTLTTSAEILFWGKDLSQNQWWNCELSPSWWRTWVVRLFTMVIHGNETPSSFGRGRNHCWSTLPPLVLLFEGEWPVVWSDRWPLRTCHNF